MVSNAYSKAFFWEGNEGPQAMTWRYVTMPSHRRYCSYGHLSHVCYEQYALEVPLVHVVRCMVATKAWYFQGTLDSIDSPHD